MIVERDPEGFEIEALTRHLDLAGRRVLEIGCGNGRLTERLARVAEFVVGLDVDEEMLRDALPILSGPLGRRVSFHLAQAEHLPFPAEAFAVAIFAWSL